MDRFCKTCRHYDENISACRERAFYVCFNDTNYIAYPQKSDDDWCAYHRDKPTTNNQTYYSSDLSEAMEVARRHEIMQHVSLDLEWEVANNDYEEIQGRYEQALQLVEECILFLRDKQDELLGKANWEVDR